MAGVVSLPSSVLRQLAETIRRSSLPAGLVLATALACTTEPPEPVDPALPYRQEGEAALASGDAETAVAAYQVALAISPRDRQAMRGLLESQLLVGEAEAALVTLEALAGLEGGTVDPCPTLAAVREARNGRGAFQEAETIARRAVRQGCPGAEASLAVLLTEAAGRAEGEEAVALYRQALALDVGEPARFRAAAAALLSQGRSREARDLLAEALERHPDDRPLRDLMVQVLMRP